MTWSRSPKDTFLYWGIIPRTVRTAGPGVSFQPRAALGAFRSATGRRRGSESPNETKGAMIHLRATIVCFLALSAVAARAQLAVTVGSPKVAGQKAILPLALKNGLA